MTPDEFKKCLGYIGLVLTNKEVVSVVKSIDDLRSDTIEFEQFYMYLSDLGTDAESKLKYLRTATYCVLSTAPNVRYVPPKTGRVFMTVGLSYANESAATCLTEAQVSYFKNHNNASERILFHIDYPSCSCCN